MEASGDTKGLLGFQAQWTISLLCVRSGSQILPLSRKNHLFLSKHTGAWGESTSGGDQRQLSAQIQGCQVPGPGGADDCDRQGAAALGALAALWGGCGVCILSLLCGDGDEGWVGLSDKQKEVEGSSQVCVSRNEEGEKSGGWGRERGLGSLQREIGRFLTMC